MPTIMKRDNDDDNIELMQATEFCRNEFQRKFSVDVVSRTHQPAMETVAAARAAVTHSPTFPPLWRNRDANGKYFACLTSYVQISFELPGRIPFSIHILSHAPRATATEHQAHTHTCV